jgi:hypothetical protein
MKYFLVFFSLFVQLFCFGQFTEDFTDGDFTTTPSWIGDDTVYTVVDVAGNKQLRSNKTIPSTTFYLATPSTQFTNGQWEFYTQLQFNTSSLNYVDIYLTSDQSNLMSASLSGYFVRIGGTTDEISLYRKVAGTATKIIDGVDGMTNTSNNTLKIKVKCSAANVWTLERDITGTGSTYVLEGSVNDATLSSSAYFGFSITQSTTSFILKHFFDDIYVGPIILDLTPPVLVSASTVSSTQIDVLFNEPLDPLTAAVASNYLLNPSVSVSSAVPDGVNNALVHLTLASPLTNGVLYTLTTSGISDLALNASGSQSVQFTYLVAESPLPGDIIINEFVCDPSPVVDLPEYEFVEIYNRTSKYFDLTGWKLGDATGDGTVQSGWLYPGEYKILCSSSAAPSFPTSVTVTSFPSLNNAGDDIVLKDNNGIVINKISYTDEWYHDAVKMNGGWSIERINANDPCSDIDNWKASTSTLGGTPGWVNSVNNGSADVTAPGIDLLVPISANQLEVYFTEGMDSTSVKNAVITVSPTLTLASNVVPSAGSHMTTLTFVENFVPSSVYMIQLQGVADCWMNTVNLSGEFALPEVPVPGDVVINEILFDPYTGGYDWIEVYNASGKLIDLKDWQLANFDDTIANHKTVSSHFYLTPGSYAILGKDSSFVLQNYPAAVPGTFVYTETPSYNVDSSTVYLIYDSVVIDKVSYTEDWHFQLLDNTDGVTLERIDPIGPSGDQNNWHSAAEAIGFGTPGGRNSQYRPAELNGDFNFTSQTVSPDNDGYEDLLQVTYVMSEPGLLGTFTIYDDRGRLIRKVFSNELLATSGTFVWDGVTDQEVKASIGTYVAVFEAYGLNGALMFTKTKAFVVAGKL